MKTKNAKHTPGPWRLSGTEVWAAHHRIVYGGGAYDAKDRNVKRANLLLVAAAPDLLECLQAIEESGVLKDPHLIKCTRAAIAKATNA